MTDQATKVAAERRRFLRAAAIAAALIVVATVVVFTKPNPFADHFRLRGDFTSTNGLRKNSVVRVGGLDVGRVTEIHAGPGNTSRVEMDIDTDEVHPRADATMTIRPRLILEGNSYVELRLGDPRKPRLRDGDLVPRSRTAVPVTLDQVLDTFSQPVRDSLQVATRELAAGLDEGEGDISGARALRRSVRELDGALESVRTVSHAARGTKSGDLTAATAGTGAVTAQLADDPRALKQLVSSYARLSGVLAARDAELGRSMRSFASLLSGAPRQLRTIDTALPPVTRLGRQLQPILREARPTLRSTRALLGQISAASRPRELPRLLRALAPVTRSLGPLESQLRLTAPVLQSVTDCIANPVVPALQQKVADGVHTTGDPVWLDLLHATASLAASSPNFDGNGTTIRLGVTESEQTVQGYLPGLGMLQGSGTIRGMNPTWLGYGVDPPSHPEAECRDQPLPDLSARKSDGPNWLTTAPQQQETAKQAGTLRSLMRKLLGQSSFGNTILKPLKDLKKPAQKPVLVTPSRPGGTGGTKPGASPVTTILDLVNGLLPKPPKQPDKDAEPSGLQGLLGKLLGGGGR